MILSRLDLKAFGRFTDVTLDLSAGPRRFHLVSGPNESGKSTSLRAITSLLFGMPHVAEDNYLHSNAQLRVGGLLVDEVSGRELECVRRRGRKATLRDALDEHAIPDAHLEEMLGGITRETFTTRFGLSHEELINGGAAILSGQGDLGQILFAAGAGVGRLREIQAELDEEGSRLFTARGSKTLIHAGMRELDERKKSLREAQIPPAAFEELKSKVDDRRRQVEKLTDQMQTKLVAIARLRAYQQALPLIPSWRSTIESLQTIQTVPSLDREFTERRRQAMSDRELARSRQVELEARTSELSARLGQLPVDSEVVQHESEIQAVFQEVAARDKADRDRLGLIRTISNMDRKIADLLGQLSVEVEPSGAEKDSSAIDEAVDRLKVSESLRSRIRGLASDHSRLIARRNDCSDAVETAKRRLADVTQELESIPNSGDPSTLSSTLESLGNPQTLLDSLSDQQDALQSGLRQCETLLRKLDGFNGSAQDAVRIVLPSESVMERLAGKLRSSSQDVLKSNETIEELTTTHLEAERRLRMQQQQLSLPTNEELTKLRSQRDRSIDGLIDAAREGNLKQDVIDLVRRHVRESDQVVDTIRNHSEQVHQREAMIARVADLRTQLTSAQQHLEDKQKAFEVAKQAWLDAWHACQVEPGQPEQMQRWVAVHEQLCDAYSRTQEEEQRIEQSRSRIARASKRLKSVLSSKRSAKPVEVAAPTQGGLFDEPQDDDLIALYDEAVAVRGERQRAYQHHETLLRKREELAEELPQAETRFEQAQKAVEDWREDWRRTTESFVTSDRVGTTEVLQMLDQISDLTAKKRERDILATRIRSIGEDEAGYAERVNRLVAAIAHPSETNQSPTSIAQSLYQRLQSERAASKSRESIREQIESTKLRLSEVAVQASTCEHVLRQLCQEAGCKSSDQLPGIEEASRTRREYQSVLRDLENQLSLLAGDQSIEALIDSAQEHQPALLELEIEEQETEAKQLRERVASTQQEIGAFQHELTLMDGSGRASELLQSIQFTAGRISKDVEEYARKRIASLLLRRAIEHYRRENQSPVLANANRFFSQLTCGEYSELKPDYDAKGKTTLFGVNSRGAEVPVGSMSTGTADSLYLALRLASLEHQLSHGKTVPLVVDDCLVQLDDRRSLAALRAFSDLSEKTQVILFTHHDHLRQLAEENLADGDYHLHELAS